MLRHKHMRDIFNIVSLYDFSENLFSFCNDIKESIYVFGLVGVKKRCMKDSASIPWYQIVTGNFVKL